MNKTKPKYTSLSAFIKGVQRVNERLTDGERLMMFALAGSVDYKTGCSRPGNEELKRVTNRKWSAIHNILRSLKGKTLIEIAEMGNGRGYATVYRFRTEDDRYPEPGKKKPYTSECIDKPKEAYTSECILPENNHTSESEKPSTSGEETIHLEARNHPLAVNSTSYKALPKRTSTTPSENSKPLGEGGFVSNSNANPTGKEKIAPYLRTVRDAFHEVMKEAECECDTLNVKAAESLFVGRAPQDVEYIASEFLASRSWKGLNYPETTFLEEFPDYFDAFLEKQATEERKREEMKRQIEQSRIEGAKRFAETLAEAQAEAEEESIQTLAAADAAGNFQL